MTKNFEAAGPVLGSEVPINCRNGKIWEKKMGESWENIEHPLRRFEWQHMEKSSVYIEGFEGIFHWLGLSTGG